MYLEECNLPESDMYTYIYIFIHLYVHIYICVFARPIQTQDHIQ